VARHVDGLVTAAAAGHAAAMKEAIHRRSIEGVALSAALGSGQGGGLHPEDIHDLIRAFPWLGPILGARIDGGYGNRGDEEDEDGNEDADVHDVTRTVKQAVGASSASSSSRRRGSIFDAPPLQATPITSRPGRALSGARDAGLGSASSPVHPWLRQARRTSSAMATLADAVEAGRQVSASITGMTSLRGGHTPVHDLHGAFDPVGLSATSFRMSIETALSVRAAAATVASGAVIGTLSLVSVDRDAVVQSLSRHLGAASVPVRRAPRGWYDVICGPELGLPALGVKALLQLGAVVSVECPVG